jgi:predicted transcriptional regulator
VCYYVSWQFCLQSLSKKCGRQIPRNTTSIGGGNLKYKSAKSKKSHAKGHTQSSNIEFELDLLKRHMMMLNAIIENEPVGIIRLSEMLNCPQHKVRYSMRILEHEGLIKPSLEGAITTDSIHDFLARLSKILSEINKSVKDIEKTLR